MFNSRRLYVNLGQIQHIHLFINCNVVMVFEKNLCLIVCFVFVFVFASPDAQFTKLCYNTRTIPTTVVIPLL